MAPLAEALAGQRAWISAIRRQQTAERAQVRVLAHDAAHDLPKLSPLASWTREQVWDYLLANDVPVNALHARGYPSIGCTPCTSAVARGRGRARAAAGAGGSRRNADSTRRGDVPPAALVSTSTEGAVR